MLLSFSRWFIYASLLTPVIVARSFFFPFVSVKQIYFRFCIEAALAFFLLYLITIFFSGSQDKIKKTLATLKHHLLHPAMLSLAAFSLVLILSSLLSPNPTVSFWSNFERGDGSFQILHYILFAILIKVLFTGESSLLRLIKTQVIVSVPVSLYAIGQMLADPTKPSYFVAASERVSGTLGNPSYLACYLIFNLAFILYLLLKNKDLLARYALIALGALQIFLIIKAQTLGAALGIFVGLIAFAAHLIVTTDNQKFKKIALIVGGVAVGFAMLFFTTKSASFWKAIPLFNRLIDTSQAYNNVKPRFWTWNTALSGIADRPLLGWGAENFPYAFDTHYNSLHYGRESFFDRTHNLFLEYLSAGGLIGFFAWLFAFYFYYRAITKRQASLWKSVLVSVPIMYLLQGFFLFDVLAIYIAFLLFFVLALADDEEGPELTRSAKEEHTALSYATMTLTAGGMLLLLYISVWAPLQKNILITTALQKGGILTYQLSQGQKTNDTPQAVIEAFHDAINYPSPVGKGEAIQMYEKFVVDIINYIAATKDATKNPEAIAQVRALLADINSFVDAHPNVTPGIKDRYFNAGINLRTGVVFGLPEAIARGKQMAEQELLLYPQRIELMLLLVELAQATNDKELFNLWGTRALQLRPDIFSTTTARDSAK